MLGPGPAYRERPKVGNGAGRDEDVAGDVGDDFLQGLHGLEPATLLVSQPANQLQAHARDQGVRGIHLVMCGGQLRLGYTQGAT